MQLLRNTDVAQVCPRKIHTKPLYNKEDYKLVCYQIEDFFLFLLYTKFGNIKYIPLVLFQRFHQEANGIG